MRSRQGIFIVLLLVFLISLESCREVGEECLIELPGESLLDVPVGFPPIPFPEDNQLTFERWELGKKLFYDPVLSIDSSLSCGSCHHAHLGFGDDFAFSPGVKNRPGVRNASPLVNLAYHPYYLREGSLPTLEMQVLVPIQEENEFAHNIVLIAEQLKNIPTYVEMSQAAYAREPDAFVITRAISTFERTLISGNSPFDHWKYQGCQNALSPSQHRGADLFFSEEIGCSNCHDGVNLTNYEFANNGLYDTYADPGRMRFTNDPGDSALFKVPTLRNIAVTAPYMHDGSLLSLHDVVEHYNSGGSIHGNKSAFIRPLNLSQKEKNDLVSFLESLTDTEFLNNPLFIE